ncbi:MAG: DNA primase [Nitrospinae bacterium]|nr:DNA primase [Nitrospinota bacterium]
MGQVSQFQPNVISDVKERADIVDTVSRYVRLKKSGNNFTGLCPFHSEKTPSFSVNPGKNIFHCFGCGESGDIFSFLMKIENISFYQSLKNVAKEVGYELPEAKGFDKKEKEKSDSEYDALEKAAKIFHNNLGKYRKQLDSFLTERGLDNTTIEAFRIGFAPESWDALLHEIRRKGVKDEELLKSGLVKKGEKTGKIYDVFRNRLIFPIENLNSRVVGFGGRILTDDKKQPKYLNSPETSLYRKSKILYGLNKAIKEANNASSLLIVEGYMDLIALHQFGVKNSAAVLGTALTDDHARLIKRHWNSVILMFDGDAAGLRASEKSFLTLCNSGINVLGIILRDGEDPDSFIRKDKESFLKLIENAKPFVKELISYWKESAQKDDKEIIKGIFPLVRSLSSSLDRSDTFRFLADVTVYSEEDLQREFGKTRKEEYSSVNQGISSQNKDSLTDKAVKNILSIMISSSSYKKKGRDELNNKDFFNNEIYWRAFQLILGEEKPLEKINEIDSDLRNVMVAIEFMLEKHNKEDFERIYTDSIKTLKNRNKPFVPKLGVNKINDEKSERYRLLKEQLSSL